MFAGNDSTVKVENNRSADSEDRGRNTEIRDSWSAQEGEKATDRNNAIGNVVIEKVSSVDHSKDEGNRIASFTVRIVRDEENDTAVVVIDQSGKSKAEAKEVASNKVPELSMNEEATIGDQAVYTNAAEGSAESQLPRIPVTVRPVASTKEGKHEAVPAFAGAPIVAGITTQVARLFKFIFGLIAYVRSLLKNYRIRGPNAVVTTNTVTTKTKGLVSAAISDKAISVSTKPNIYQGGSSWLSSTQSKQVPTTISPLSISSKFPVSILSSVPQGTTKGRSTSSLSSTIKARFMSAKDLIVRGAKSAIAAITFRFASFSMARSSTRQFRTLPTTGLVSRVLPASLVLFVSSITALAGAEAPAGATVAAAKAGVTTILGVTLPTWAVVAIVGLAIGVVFMMIIGLIKGKNSRTPAYKSLASRLLAPRNLPFSFALLAFGIFKFIGVLPDFASIDLTLSWAENINTILPTIAPSLILMAGILSTVWDFVRLANRKAARFFVEYFALVAKLWKGERLLGLSAVFNRKYQRGQYQVGFEWKKPKDYLTKFVPNHYIVTSLLTIAGIVIGILNVGTISAAVIGAILGFLGS